MKNSPLTFCKFQKINSKRSKKIFPQCKEWSFAEWSNALAGEAGEVCNLTKKMARDNTRNRKNDMKELGKEIADVVCYASLLASAVGLDLEDVTIDKFNEVSQRKNSKIRL
jgi:NTP pyrophosphatase (non-canonical NTP hydrolase)